MSERKWLPAFVFIMLVGLPLGCGSNAGNISSTSTTVKEPPQQLIKSDIPLKLISITSPIWPGDNLNVIIQTAPNVIECLFLYHYYHTYTGGREWLAVSKELYSDDKGNASVVLPTPVEDPGYYRLHIKVGYSSFGSSGDDMKAYLITSFLVQ